MTLQQWAQDRRSRRRNGASARSGSVGRRAVELVESGLVLTFLLAIVGSMSLAIALLTRLTTATDIF